MTGREGEGSQPERELAGGLCDAERLEGRHLADALSLRPARPKVMRLSWKVLAGFGGVASVVLGGAAWVALGAHPKAPPAHELYDTDNHTPAEGLSTLPHDYAGLPKPKGGVPQLGPPLPGDLGKPILDAGVTPPGVGGSAAASGLADPAQQRREEARDRVRQTADTARVSGLFASQAAVAEKAQGLGAPDAAAAVAALGLTATPAPAGAPSTSPAEGDHKLAFLNAAADHRTVSVDRVEAPASPDVVQAGAVIAAALITGLRSDLPGQVTAQVTQAVYDSPTGRILLIPQGARLIGEYDAQVTFGQTRALLAWTRLILPNGRSIVLERQPGADAQGYAGVQGKVDDHWGSLFKAAALSTLLSVGSEAGTSSSENDLAQALRRGASDSISQTGRQVVGRSLTIAPTLTVAPGSPVRVMVTRDLVLEPYAG